MDVDLLSKMLKELILDNDIVTLPGMGAFIAEVVPSAFSDRGYTINPPYRKLYFRSRADEDKLLVSLYASSNGIDVKTAEKLLLEFTSELKEHLFSHKNVILPGLGRLRATKENDIFFIPDEDLDIYPSGFGLQPISLKTHQETPEEVTAAVESLKSIIENKNETIEVDEAVEVAENGETVNTAEVSEVAEVSEAAETEMAVTEEPEKTTEAVEIVETIEVVEAVEVAENGETVKAAEVSEAAEVFEAAETEMAVTEEPEETKDEIFTEPIQETIEEVIEEVAEEEIEEETETIQKQSEVGNKLALNPAVKKILITLAIAVGAVVLFLGIFLALAHLCPDLIDSILYTEEELRILNGTL